MTDPTGSPAGSRRQNAPGLLPNSVLPDGLPELREWSGPQGRAEPPVRPAAEEALSSPDAARVAVPAAIRSPAAMPDPAVLPAPPTPPRRAAGPLPDVPGTLRITDTHQLTDTHQITATDWKS
jgi:hypothetical protein